MDRISIVGCPGAGKSTFALALGRSLARTVDHLDFAFVAPNGFNHPKDAQEAALETLLAQPRYLLEGGYPLTYPRRIADCDTLIWLDTAPQIRLWNMFKRHWSLRRQIGHPPVLRESRKQRRQNYALSRVLRQQIEHEAELEPVFAAPPPDKRLVRLRSRADAQAFLQSLAK
ncbi:MAG: hypothetical protein JNK34_02250 [Tabrizicola sp.]|nr:hypothetical protein [Tabrizicola sp.]